jgi:hypothetical protein
LFKNSVGQVLPSSLDGSSKNTILVVQVSDASLEQTSQCGQWDGVPNRLCFAGRVVALPLSRAACCAQVVCTSSYEGRILCTERGFRVFDAC